MDTSNIKNKENQTSYQKARERVDALKSFYFSILIYILINVGLIYIWYNYSSHDFQWFWFPIVGWGIGLIFKGLAAYDIDFIFGKSWEKRKLQEFLGKEKQDMNVNFNDTSSYTNARKKVEGIKGFYSHFTVYILVNSFIVTAIVWHTNIDVFSFAALSTPLFWGIGLLSHFIGVFGEDFLFGKDWEEQKIKELMKND